MSERGGCARGGRAGGALPLLACGQFTPEYLCQDEGGGTALRSRPVEPAGGALPPLCRPGGWIAEWRRLAMIAACNGRAAA